MEISKEMPERCPEDLVCYTEEEHEGIERALLKLKKVERWASITWNRCKPTSDEGETP